MSRKTFEKNFLDESYTFSFKNHRIFNIALQRVRAQLYFAHRDYNEKRDTVTKLTQSYLFVKRGIQWKMTINEKPVNLEIDICKKRKKELLKAIKYCTEAKENFHAWRSLYEQFTLNSKG